MTVRTLERVDAAALAESRSDEWAWLVQDVTPAPDALDVLLEAAARLPDAVLLAAKVLRPDGSLHFVPAWPHYGRVSDIVEAAPARALPLREASFHGVLVRTAVIDEVGPPLDHPAAAREWTARILRTRPGYLVPAATVTLTRAPDPGPAAEIRDMLWAARSRDAWTPRERFDRRFQAAVAAARLAGGRLRRG